MNIPDIIALRLQNQLLTRSSLTTPEEVINWMGAVQAQDYTAAKWAVGLRTKDSTDKQIEEAFNQGKILRTHVMRPTWHFVTPKDIRWMLALTALHIHEQSKYYYRQLELNDKIFAKSTGILETSLAGGNYLTRAEIGDIFIRNGIQIKNPLQLTYLIEHAELEGVICNGPLKGKQHTFALLDERISKTKPLEPDEALAELTLRYFQSRGPATLMDFVWWSGLKTSEAKKGIELIKTQLIQEKIEENIYWFTKKAAAGKDESKMYLLSNYDEYIVGYKDRNFIFDTKYTSKLDARANPLFQHTIILEGKIVGTWKREFKKGSLTLSTNIFESLGKSEEKLLQSAIGQFEVYSGLITTPAS